MKTLAIALLSASLPLVACGGDDPPQEVPDARRRPDAMATPDAMTAACTVSKSNFGDLGALPADASDIVVNPNNPAQYRIRAIGALEPPQTPPAPVDVLLIELYSGFGVFQNGVVVGNHALTGPEANYVDCGACVRVLTNIQQNPGDDSHDYMASAGSLNITAAGTAVGQTLTFTMSNVMLRKVNFTVDANNNITAQADDPSGCTTAISNVTYTGTLEAPPATRDARAPMSVVLTRKAF